MSTALYRRYRPERFEDVIGQEHVTEPLMQALRHDRVHHAYLFSGPRGCGKTTSARILARCLNCEAGPTPTPCGECRSCRELASGGPGSIDVVEIDAASHGGVDDARELREKAFFAPAASRFKIYIIDEAHMVTNQGFNALLKIVEEPPPHLKFVFATTEPEKVIGTIRSRTHHYPFRLVPPKTLQDYLELLCEREGIAVERTVLPLVVRAGGGSVRDSLSVLDQLIAGAGPDGVTYPLAIGLLGFTDATLLDDVVDAFAAGDGSGVFHAVDQVVEAGHNPRRFVEDLLERFRDLIVLDAVPDATSILGEIPDDQLERMRGQAGRFGTASLSRAADIINTGLTEMRGTTSPRLQLELICARVLLPGAYDDERSLHARLDRLEHRLSIAADRGDHAVVPPAPASSPPAAPVARPTSAPTAGPTDPAATAPAPTAAAPAAPPAARADHAVAQPPAAPAAATPPRRATDAPTDAPAVAASGLDLAGVRRLWPTVLEQVKHLKRLTWTLLVHNAQVLSIDGDTLVLGMLNAGARESFLRVGSPEIVRQAVIDVLGVDLQVETVIDPSAHGSDTGATHARPVTPPRGGPAPSSSQGSSTPSPSAAARAAAAAATEPASAASPGGNPAAAVSISDEVGPDDPDADDGLRGRDLLARELGAQVIDEYDER